MRLGDLNPQYRRVYRDFSPETGGIPTNDYELTFVCPSCGSPFVITVVLGLEPPDEKVPRWQANELPVASNVPWALSDLDWIDRLTLTPSINCTKSGHGMRHPTCTFHGNIVSGSIV